MFGSGDKLGKVYYKIQTNYGQAKLITISSHTEMFLRKGVLKICCRFTEEHPRGSVISIKFQSNFI